MSKNSREATESTAGCNQKHLRCFANGASELLLEIITLDSLTEMACEALP